MPTAIYLRISSDPLDQRAGVMRQRFDCEMIVAKRGWPDPVFYEDNDVSAWSGKRRPAWERLLADLPTLDAVVAWDLDRLVRQPRDLEKFLDKCAEAHITRVATAQGDLDLTSDAGRFTARILAAVATKESDDKSRRIRRAKQDAAERGEWQGSRPPFGYRADGGLVVVEEDAALVRSACRHILDGGSVRALVAKGGPRSHPGWRELLLSPTIAGRTSSGHEGNWEPIIDVETWARVRAVLTDPQRRAHRGTERRHWLAGLLVCGRCDAGMVHNARERKGVDYSRYICSAHRHLSIAAPAVEEFMLGVVLEAGPTVRSAPTSLELPPEGGDAPLGDPQQRLDEMTALYVAGKLTRTAWEAAYAAAQAAPVVTPSAPTPTSDITAERWASWTPAEQHTAARGLLDAVVVLPGAAALEDRLDFRWIA
jgi:DNA invertase Pin-like site-specific DNA recombinase